MAPLRSKRHDALDEEGGNRICVIQVVTLEGPVSCYLPFRGNEEADRDFMNVALSL